MDTGANCNTISRKIYRTVVDQGLKCVLILGPSEGLSINLVGGQTLDITGDRVLIQTEVGTNLRNFYSDQDFLIFDQDSEDIVMGVQWYNYIFRELHDTLIQIVDIRARGLIMENPIDFG